MTPKNTTTPKDLRGVRVADGDLTFLPNEGRRLNSAGRRRLARALQRGVSVPEACAAALEAQGIKVPSAERGKW